MPLFARAAVQLGLLGHRGVSRSDEHLARTAAHAAHNPAADPVISEAAMSLAGNTYSTK